MTKVQFGLHIWIGIFLCLFSVSCSDDDTDSIKGDDDDTDLSINHWIEKNRENRN
jgi:carboxyl-terminal processing protease